MKHIEKGRQPQEFSDWLALENENWHPNWDNLGNPQKNLLHDSLMRDQGWICCYCQQRISPEDSHIEHVTPRSVRPASELAFDNLLASCGHPGWDESTGEPRKLPDHCGNAKLDWHDGALFISPLDPECERMFSYVPDGTVAPLGSEVARAEATLRVLKLNNCKLKEMRNNAFESIIQVVRDKDHIETVQLVQQIIESILRREDSGRFPAFCQAVALMAEIQFLTPDSPQRGA